MSVGRRRHEHENYEANDPHECSSLLATPGYSRSPERHLIHPKPLRAWGAISRIGAILMDV